MNKESKIFVAGHRGLVGGAILRLLQAGGYKRLIVRTRGELDLSCQEAVEAFFAKEKPEYVFLAAARVGGILANSTRPAEFMRDNLLIQILVLDAAHRHGVKKFLLLGSSCIYPRLAPQPLKEEFLLSAPLEETNEAYAIAKIAGIKAAQAYRSQFGFNAICLMPTNLYGPGDNFDLETAHVLPALLRKFHQARAEGAKEAVVWGTGSPLREFLHVDDLAEACVFAMRSYDAAEIINVGVGKDISIRVLAELISEVVGFAGTICFDSKKPDGTPRKLLDISKLSALGWRAKIGLREGLEQTYHWYREHEAEILGGARLPA